jgi:hypothetical protein
MHQIGALIACAIGGSVWLSVPVLPLPVPSQGHDRDVSIEGVIHKLFTSYLLFRYKLLISKAIKLFYCIRLQKLDYALGACYSVPMS